MVSKCVVSVFETTARSHRTSTATALMHPSTAAPAPALAAGVNGGSNLYGWHKYEGNLPPVSYFALYIRCTITCLLETSLQIGRDAHQGSQFCICVFLQQQILLQVGDWHVFSEEGEFPGGVCLLVRPDGMCLRLARAIVLHMDGKRKGSIHSFAYNDLNRNRQGLGRLRIIYFERQV
jgi:hypothetical protein